MALRPVFWVFWIFLLVDLFAYFVVFSEDDLSEVLQIEEVFSDAIRGNICNTKELAQTFGRMTKEEIIKQVNNLTIIKIQQIQTKNQRYPTKNLKKTKMPKS